MNGQDCYQAYGRVTNFKNFQGNPMPEWGDLPDIIKLAWETVATAKDQSIAPNIPLDDRERAQIAHAKDYAYRHSGAGIPGHGQFILIAKLAQVLGL
jgi:hypothetical protein